MTPTDEPSPTGPVVLVDIRSRLVNGDIALFRVDRRPDIWADVARGEAARAGCRWRKMRRRRSLAGAPVGARPRRGISISKLGGQLAPARTPTGRVTRRRNLLWSNTAEALFVEQGLEPGFKYQVTSADNDPSPDALRQATASGADPVYYTLPDSVPNELRALAQQVTARATTPYDQVRTLQDWFRANFTYSLTVQRGHSNDAMINFLSIRKGYCEQFSGTFATMARSLGLPTRVVVGFTPGELRSDGLYHVAGQNAHAWDEVWFDGYGWTLFDPTPGRGSPGAEAHTACRTNRRNGTPGTGTATATNCVDLASCGMTKCHTRSMAKAISVRLDDDAERALRMLEASGLTLSEAIRSSLLASAERLNRRRVLVEEAAALEADEQDRAEMLSVAVLMESMRATR